MAIRMQQRRGTEEQWTAANPVLAPGEIGFESDTNKFKIGNGVTPWENLDYFVGEGTLDDSLAGYVLASAIGEADGVAALDANGKVPAGQLDLDAYATETYVDDAISNIPAPDLTGYATEEYVDTAVSALVDSAPEVLDTLNELATALNNDENFATTVTNSIANKASSENPEFSVVGSFVYDTALSLSISPTGARPGELLLSYLFAPPPPPWASDGYVPDFQGFNLSEGQIVKLLGTLSNSLQIDLIDFEIVSYNNGNLIVYPANPLEIDRVTDFVAANPGTTSYSASVPETLQPYDKTVTALELGYLDGVTSGIQSQLDSKLGSEDFDLDSPVDGSFLKYNSTTSKWEDAIIIDGGNA